MPLENFSFSDFSRVGKNGKLVQNRLKLNKDMAYNENKGLKVTRKSLG